MTASPPPPRAPRLHALVPCAGTGSRAGTAIPKQYQPVAGRPMVRHTLDAFAAVPRLATVLVAVAAGDRTLAGVPGITLAECGGPTRAATVLGGLRALREAGAADADWVLVHDAARCLVTPALIDRLIDACLDDPVGGLLAQPLADTLKHGPGGRVRATVPREDHWLAQTPQMFRLGVLARALEAAGDAVTDEASAVEAAGLQPRLVPGSSRNFKVTWPEDFALAEALLTRNPS
ncbi:2-C-methyl-D-erythritol 4-phosphate cytidylyltransferase [Ramlibacter sp. MAHUQ-53]|uniref:2-C-methyl-D-erythritol 4-phosphate cytidylyltransferase n=1 Tax=unclassified Ramlibacter TaxID=2617605 RepID=UPI00362A38B6